jgi:hypothetical protein
MVMVQVYYEKEAPSMLRTAPMRPLAIFFLSLYTVNAYFKGSEVKSSFRSVCFRKRGFIPPLSRNCDRVLIRQTATGRFPAGKADGWAVPKGGARKPGDFGMRRACAGPYPVLRLRGLGLEKSPYFHAGIFPQDLPVAEFRFGEFPEFPRRYFRGKEQS